MRPAKLRYLLCVAAIVFCCTALACPNCKNSKPDNDDPTLAPRLSEGYFWSYIAMSSVPFLAVGCIAGALVRASRSAKRTQEVLNSNAQNRDAASE